MASSFLIHLPLWVISLVLVGVVYFRAPRYASHQAFTGFALTLVTWTFCVRMVYYYADSPSGVWWARLCITAASLVGSSFIVFCQAFPESKRLDLHSGTRRAILLGVLVTALTLTPLMVQDVRPAGDAGIKIRYGSLYPVFGVCLLVVLGHGFWTLTQKWRAARGRHRQQICYLWLGAFLTLSGSMATNLILPALTGNSRFITYGPYFTLFFVGLTTHAIIRHRLMDARLVIRRGVTFSLSLGVMGSLMWGISALASMGLGLPFDRDALVLLLITGIGGVVVFHPVRVGIQRLLDKYCYREPYDYRQATRTMSQVLAGLVRLAPLCEYLTTFIRSTLRVEVVAVYVYHAQAVLERYACQSTSGNHDLPHILLSEPEVLRGVAHARELIVRDELGRWDSSHIANSLLEVLASLQSDVLIPLIVEDNVAALITVGGKLSGDPFFAHDLELLSTVGHQASVALRRAQLYEEITWMKEYNESILRQMESGVIAVSHQGVITMMNAAAARLLRVEAAQAVGRAFAEILPEALSVSLIHTLAGTATYMNQEATLPVPTGCRLPIALSTSVLHRAEGELTGAILVFHDLSRLKALEEEKNRVERLASIGAFMSGIAHEIKNPLVAIKTLAELLPEQYDDAEFRETFTQVALHEVERIDTLVYRLRSMGSSSPLQMRLISVLTPLDETLGLISGELTKRHITLAYEHHERLPPIMGDHDQLQQVFLNLCLNSIEAMEKDGTLRVALRVDHAPDDTAAALLIDISDTGPGIPVEYLSTIFEPFVTSKDTGSGLGLAICKGIIEYHRGTLSAANRADGPGAIFTLRLPVVQEEEPYAVSTTHCQYPQATDAIA